MLRERASAIKIAELTIEKAAKKEAAVGIAKNVRCQSGRVPTGTNVNDIRAVLITRGGRQAE